MQACRTLPPDVRSARGRLGHSAADAHHRQCGKAHQKAAPEAFANFSKVSGRGNHVVFAKKLLATSVAVDLGRPLALATQGVGFRTSEPVVRLADFGAQLASPDARRVADWVADSRDNGASPFVIVDKKEATVHVFDAGARLVASTPVLLGSAPGDDSVPGIGAKPLAEVHPQERTTPAGRFVGERGRNALGEDVVWVDYAAAVSMHRVRLTNPAEHRLERLATPTIADNRISYGCINVPVAFFDTYIQPVFAAQRALVYVLPEIKPIEQVFGSPSQDVAALHGLGPIAATALTGRCLRGNKPSRVLALRANFCANPSRSSVPPHPPPAARCYHLPAVRPWTSVAARTRGARRHAFVADRDGGMRLSAKWSTRISKPCARHALVAFNLLAFLAAPALAGADDDRAVPVAARDLADRVLAERGHAGLPFAVVDKRTAMLMVYFSDGRLAGVTPVLLGRTLGDRAVPGVGERAQLGQLRVEDRTTPAGRFTSEPGHNLAGEAIVWIDYGNALAIHRLRPGPSQDFRERRLASPSAIDRRVSAGCVVVPTVFYDEVVAPVLGRSRGVVYVMGEDGAPRAL